MGVIEPEIAPMQRRNRRCQAQSKPRAWQGSARLQADESFHRMLAVCDWNPRSVVGDAEQHPIACAFGLNEDLLAIGLRSGGQRLHGAIRLAVFDRVLDEV